MLEFFLPSICCVRNLQIKFPDDLSSLFFTGYTLSTIQTTNSDHVYHICPMHNVYFMLDLQTICLRAPCQKLTSYHSAKPGIIFCGGSRELRFRSMHRRIYRQASRLETQSRWGGLESACDKSASKVIPDFARKLLTLNSLHRERPSSSSVFTVTRSSGQPERV
jgi:hypothetical protein